MKNGEKSKTTARLTQRNILKTNETDETTDKDIVLAHTHARQNGK